MANTQLFRLLPKVDLLLEQARQDERLKKCPPALLVQALRKELDLLRQQIKDGSLSELPERSELIRSLLDKTLKPSRIETESYINAGGKLFADGCNRMAFSGEVVTEAARVFSSAVKASDKYPKLRKLIRQLTGAEDAIVSSGPSSGLLLALTALASSGEVIVASSHLIEQANGIRIDDTIETSGGSLREIGCTNRVHLKDYKAALTAKTSAILYVAKANVKSLGFTKEVSVQELSQLAKEASIPLIVAEGTGALVDLRNYGMERNNLVQDFLNQGAQLVSFPSNLLIGGPSGSILAGQADYITSVENTALYKHMTMGHLEKFLLEETLRLFLEKENLEQKHLLYKILAKSAKEVHKSCRKACADLKEKLADKAEIEVIEGTTSLGNPLDSYKGLATYILKLRPLCIPAHELKIKLEDGLPSIFCHVNDNVLLFDFRTLDETDVRLLTERLTAEC